MFGAWQIKLAVVLGFGLLLGASWLHGRSNGVQAEREKMLAANARAMESVIERQAETARVMGEAVRAAHERENAALEARRQADMRRRQVERWQVEQIKQDSSCADWAAAPVGCRLRPDPATSSGG